MFHYTACGLADVHLVNGYEVSETPRGTFFSIHDVKGLHRAIGHELLKKESCLTGDEFRFLRTELEMSRKVLGEILDVSHETIKKWESGENPVQKAADVCLRELYIRKYDNDAVRVLIEEINQHERASAHLKFRELGKSWRLCA